MKKIIRVSFVVVVLFIAALFLVQGARVPIVGSDSGSWGTILNNFLLAEHDQNGTHRNVTVIGDLRVVSILGNKTALSVIQAGGGNIAEFKTHLTVGSKLSISSEKNELSTILKPTSSFEIRMKSNVTWTSKPEWNVSDVGNNTAPAFADLDNDGDYDLLVGTSSGGSVAFENTGTVISPNWTSKPEWDVSDVGNNTAPAFADLDNDGDYDLLIGISSGESVAFENTGTVFSPIWTSKPEWNVSDVGNNASPAFADLDNDGDYDLLIGEAAGGSAAFENNGSVFHPNWTSKPEWNVSDVGNNAAPAFVDLDNDGDYDLLVGTSSGECAAFENSNSTFSPIWTSKPEWNVSDVGNNAAPAFVDLDNDGDYDLLVGTSSGGSAAFENTGANITSLFIGKFGKFGIGTTSPTQTLHVIGSLNVSGSAKGDAIFISSSGNITILNNITIGSPTIVVNITIYSPDGTPWHCGPNDLGVWNCTG